MNKSELVESVAKKNRSLQKRGDSWSGDGSCDHLKRA